MLYIRVLALLACALPACSAGGISLDEYRHRRAALRHELGESVLILFGADENETVGNLRAGFYQEPNFYYLTGWTEPESALVLTPAADILLIPSRNPEREKWTGPKTTPADPNLRGLTGFDQVVPLESFEARLPDWIGAARKIYTLTADSRAASLQRLLPLRSLADAAPAIARLRAVKSPAEVALIQHATEVTIDAHFAAWPKIKPGLMEYQVANVMASTYFDRGCERHAYAPIVGSGPNAAVLHYSRNRRRMDSGELVLMDVGAECFMYVTDITRTVPVNGRFTPRQRELYDIVLGAQKAAIAAAKPGMTILKTTPNSLYRIALDYLNARGKDKHGHPLGKYFTHNIGHHVGLDVHDPSDPAIPLKPGMVITIEPGLYIPEEGIGIRIEDVILITENGAKVLTSRLPREPAEIEKALARR